jgi:hypothetical protein
MLQRLSWQIGIVALIMVSGCKPAEEPTYPVRGSVTFDGTPIADGQIYFMDKDTAVLNVALPIRNGKYDGLVKPGTWRVEIHAYRDEGVQSPMPGMPPEPVRTDYIPPKYGSESDLSATVAEDGSGNEFNFDLKSAPSADRPE